MAIVHNAAMNVGVHIFKCAFLFRYIPRNEIFVSYSSSMLDFFYNSFFLWLSCVFITGHRLSLVAASGGHCLWCKGFSLWWFLWMWSTGSGHVGLSSCSTWALKCGVSGCGAQAWLSHGMWCLPALGIKLCPLHWQVILNH